MANRTGDRDVAARLFLVDHVVACNRIDFDLGFRRRNVDVVRLLVGRSRGVASVVSRGDFGFTGNGVDGDRSFRQVGIDTVAAVGFSRSGVTCSVFGLNLGVNIAVLGQFGTRNVYVPGLATRPP
nr:hypothetical protein [Alcaligenes faecalis]